MYKGDDKLEKKEKSNFSVATAATAHTAYANAATNMNDVSGVVSSAGTTVTINPQLSEWIKAKTLYDEKVRNDPNPDILVMRSIIMGLADSLQSLFGMNYGYVVDKLPSLPTLANSGLFQLKNCRPDFYRSLTGLDALAGDLRHTGIYKAQRVFKQVTKESVENYVKQSKKIWLWALDVIHRGNIPPDQLIEFNNFPV